LTADPIDWLLGLELLGMKFGLENMHRLTAELNHPERHFKTIHVAGTNGKGSVTAMVEAALHAAGHRSARYTSPHLERLEERFVVGAREVQTDALRETIAVVRQAVDRLQQHGGGFSPTFFECATATAFELFRRQRVSIAVIEAGLGGRLDATNVVDPVATAITSIDFDHEALLGTTLPAIAAEKAGIIKHGVPLVTGRLSREADTVVAETAARRNAPLIRALAIPPHFQNVKPALKGAHQRDNIAIAIALLETLGGLGISVPGGAIESAIENVSWPGRLEHLERDGVSFLIDAAHNPAGARALASYLSEIQWSDATLVFGAMHDKKVVGMLGYLLPVVSSIVCTSPPTPRAEPAERLAEVVRELSGRPVHVEPDPARALALARTLSSRVVIAGSIFLIGPLRGILR
jgi:dihydrofolate synthase / folylpolyglutamate synthase